MKVGGGGGRKFQFSDKQLQISKGEDTDAQNSNFVQKFRQNGGFQTQILFLEIKVSDWKQRLKFMGSIAPCHDATAVIHNKLRLSFE